MEIVRVSMQCWDCGAYQLRGRMVRCEACGGPVEILQTWNKKGQAYSWNLDAAEYRKRGIVVKGMVNDLGVR